MESRISYDEIPRESRDTEEISQYNKGSIKQPTFLHEWHGAHENPSPAEDCQLAIVA